MSTTLSSVLGLTIPTPFTDEPYDQTQINGNWNKIDAAIGAKTTKFTTTTVANSTVETSIGSMTIPANAPQGSVFHLALWGNYGNVASATTLTFRVKLGGVTVHTFGIGTPATAFTAQTWKFESDLICLTTGVAGTWNAGTLGFVKTSNNMNMVGDVASISRDQTVANTFEITAQWAVANAANTLASIAGWGSRITNA